MCHAVGQTKSIPILLKYGQGDWNALHRDLYGDLVFPLQVVINLNAPGVDDTGGEFLLCEQRSLAPPRRSSPRAMVWCSRPETDPWNPSVAGRPHQCGTACR
jgi:hypothetical protein